MIGSDRRENVKQAFCDGRAYLLSGKVNRKLILCTDSPICVNQIGNSSKDAMVLMPLEIELYNQMVEQDDKLMFQPGHPRIGCTYVQHPFRHNTYFEVNSFHDSLRERKQNELLRILESLGAYSARVEVRNENSENRIRRDETSVNSNAEYGVFSANGSRETRSDRSVNMSSSMSATKDWTFNPPSTPSLPDDLVFYPTEETWQQLAQSVLRGGLKHAVVDLEYKSEYGVSEKYLSDLSGSFKLLIPSFSMNLKKGFEENLNRLTHTQWHYEVSFENENGERAGGVAKVAEVLGGSSEKIEALFIKRAKRYAQSDGHINAEQRADLEAFAKKYGIDDFRMEEMIEDAFL